MSLRRSDHDLIPANQHASNTQENLAAMPGNIKGRRVNENTGGAGVGINATPLWLSEGTDSRTQWRMDSPGAESVSRSWPRALGRELEQRRWARAVRTSLNRRKEMKRSPYSVVLEILLVFCLSVDLKILGTIRLLR